MHGESAQIMVQNNHFELGREEVKEKRGEGGRFSNSVTPKHPTKATSPMVFNLSGFLLIDISNLHTSILCLHGDFISVPPFVATVIRKVPNETFAHRVDFAECGCVPRQYL